MIIVLPILSLVVIFLAVVLVRTFLPSGVQLTPDTTPDELPGLDPQIPARHLSELVAIRSVSYRDRSRIDTAAFAACVEMLRRQYPLVHATLELETVDTYNLIYRWKGKSEGEVLLVLSHYDVVPAPDEGWLQPPFSGAISEGYIWGRGTLDNKVTLVAIMDAAESLLAKGFVPEHDIYFAFGSDEEIHGAGAQAMAKLLFERGVKPALVLDEGGAIVRDIFPGLRAPLALVGVCEKGVSDFRIELSAAGGHASAPPRQQIASLLGQCILRLDQNKPRSRLSPPVVALLKTIGRNGPWYLRLVTQNLWCFSPLVRYVFGRLGGEMAALCRTTMAFTQLEGSPAANVLPRVVSANINVRVDVHENLAHVLKRLQRLARPFGASVQLVGGSEPSPVSPSSGPAWERLSSCIARSFPGVSTSPYVMLGASDSRHYHRYFPNVYRFSPLELSTEDIASMHAPNERLKVESLARAVEFYARLFAGPTAG